MLLFRSEEHVNRWCWQWGIRRGAVLSAKQCAQLAHGWYQDRLEPTWKRKTPLEAQALFFSLGLTGSFWALG